MYFYEERILGSWRPRKAASKPATKNGREKRDNGETGRQIRGISEILPVHEVLSLSQLQKIYGAE